MFGLGKDQSGLSRLAGLGGDGRLGLDGQGPQQSRILQNQHNVQQGLTDNFTPSKDWQVRKSTFILLTLLENPILKMPCRMD